MTDLEQLAESGSTAEILRRGEQLIRENNLGGMNHLIKLLKTRKRYSESISLARNLFDQYPTSANLNVMLSAVFAAKRREDLLSALSLTEDFSQAEEFEYDTHLLSTWLRVLVFLDERMKFWQVYDRVCTEEDKRGNAHIIAQHYQMLIRTGRYREVVDSFEDLHPRLKSDDLLRKLLAQAHIESGELEKAEAALQGTRDDFKRRSLEKKLSAERGALGMASTGSGDDTLSHGGGTSDLRVFLSHTSRDKELAAALVGLLRNALNLGSSAIRCTSVDGYRLPAGAHTDKQLRREVHEADSLIGIISEQSLRSLYVAFELGARWGAGKNLIPLLAPGTSARILSGPLAGINALSCGSPAQLHQLIFDLGKQLGIEPQPAAAFQGEIDAILAIGQSRP